MNYQKSAGIILYYVDKTIMFLLLKYSDYWGYAKGQIEMNESEEQAALRELKEETSIDSVKIIPGFRYSQDWFFRLNNETIKKNAVFFIAKIDKEQVNKVSISFEHEDFAWLNYEDAKTRMKIKNNREMLEAAYNFIIEHEKQKTLF